MPWLAYHNPEINWKTGEVKMIRCPEKCGKQWRPKQGKVGWQKQKEEEAREEAGKKWKAKAKKKTDINGAKRQTLIAMELKRNTMNIKRVVEKWKIWNEKKKVAKSEAEAKKLVSEKFYR